MKTLRFLFILAAFSLSIASPTRGDEPSISSKLKQLSLYIIMYAQDNNDILKIKSSSFKIQLQGYYKKQEHVIDDSFFVYNADGTTIPVSFNSNLEGGTNKVNGQWSYKNDDVVMLYTGRNNTLMFDKEGYAYVAVRDGSVQRVDSKQAKSLSWIPSSSAEQARLLREQVAREKQYEELGRRQIAASKKKGRIGHRGREQHC